MKKLGIKVVVDNRRAYYDYFILDKFEAGIVLTGTEIKSIRQGSVNIGDSYVIIKNSEAFILNMHISEYAKGTYFNHDALRTRKLLLHKREILKLEYQVKKDSITLIPTKLYLKDGRAKLEFAIAKGKKNYDKRQSEKERSISKEIAKHVSK